MCDLSLYTSLGLLVCLSQRHRETSVLTFLKRHINPDCYLGTIEVVPDLHALLKSVD